MTYDEWKTYDSGYDDRCEDDDEERPEPEEREGCSDCGAEFDHEPDCMAAAELLQALHDEETAASGGDAAYGAAVRPLVEELINAQGDTLRELRALGALFTAHNGDRR